MSIKTLVLIVIAATIVTGAFFFTEYRNRDVAKPLYTAPEITVASSSTETETSLATADVDTDNDGLKDWEENLWGTDPRNPDTDSDGTKDNDEVKAGRNPLVAKTKKVDDRFSALAEKAATSTEKLTLTDQFGRDVFAQYMALKQSGLASDKASQQELINQLLLNSTYSVNPKIFIDTDIRTTTDTSSIAIHQYGNDVATIFKNDVISSRSEGVIVRDALSKNNPETLKELDPIIASYKKILNHLLAVEAPKTMLPIHKDLVNAVSKTLFVAESLRKADVDPIVSLQGLGRYQEASKGLYDAIQAIKTYITFVGVTYTSSEAGSLFTQ